VVLGVLAETRAHLHHADVTAREVAVLFELLAGAACCTVDVAAERVPRGCSRIFQRARYDGDIKRDCFSTDEFVNIRREWICSRYFEARIT